MSAKMVKNRNVGENGQTDIGENVRNVLKWSKIGMSAKMVKNRNVG